MKIRLIIVFILTLINVQAQNTVGTTFITENVSEGYTLISTHTNAILFDNCGRVINEWQSQYRPGNSVYLLPNGNLLRAGRLDDGSSNIGFGGQGGIVELFNWEGEIIWSFVYSSDEFRQHHDVFPMPNGNVLILAVTVMSEEEALNAGRDPSLISESALYNERIFEVEPVGANDINVVWEWNANEHLIQDFDSTKANFGVISENPGRINLNYLGDFEPDPNWLHINSIQYDSERDQIVISSRKFSEIWVIDHSTTLAESASDSGGTYGQGGNLLYRWGNPEAYGFGNISDRQLFGQHTPYYIPTGLPNEGKIMVFNNGFQRTPLFSEVFIIDPPVSSAGFYEIEAGSAFGPASPDFKFPETPPNEDSEFFSAIVSSAQQLPNGNILICEGREAIIFEIDENRNKVWEYIVPISNADGSSYEQGGEPPINNFSFRATKYSLDYPAFVDRDLSPGNPLEINPDISDCIALSETSFENNQAKIYPNPAENIINIETIEPVQQVEIYDISGKILLKAQRSNSIDISQLSTGVFFIKIYTVKGIIDRKIIKQ